MAQNGKDLAPGPQAQLHSNLQTFKLQLRNISTTSVSVYSLQPHLSLPSHSFSLSPRFVSLCRVRVCVWWTDNNFPPGFLPAKSNLLPLSPVPRLCQISPQFHTTLLLLPPPPPPSIYQFDYERWLLFTRPPRSWTAMSLSTLLPPAMNMAYMSPRTLQRSSN